MTAIAAAAPAPTRADASGRLAGVDLARLVAIIGMMGAHTALAWGNDTAALRAVVDGPPSTLFAVLGGASVVLAARGRLARGERGRAVLATLARGLLVALIGFLVIPLSPLIYVVLVPFGLAIALAAPLVIAPSWAIGALLAALAALGGSALVWARQALPVLETGTSHSPETLVAAPAATLSNIVLTGVYPALTWLTYLLVGMLAIRWLLRSRERGSERRTLGWLAAIGAAALAAATVATELAVRALGPVELPGGDDLWHDVLLQNGYGAIREPGALWQLLAAPHSGTVADVLRTAGIALVVIALLGLLVRALPQPAMRAIGPLRAAGAAPLTIYVAHVLGVAVLATVAQTTGALWVGEGLGAWALHVAIALAIGVVLWAARSRGPLERGIGWVVDRVVPAGASPGASARASA